MLRCCLIGHPLGHSISPRIHSRLFELSGSEASYTLLPIEPGAFARAAPMLREYDGFNVTIPYKQQIIPFLDRLSPRAARYGAVNTVENRAGELCGHNTDAEGLLRALRAAEIPLLGRVLLCGTGGVAHMAACEVLEHGCSLVVGARDEHKAAAFAQALHEMYPDAAVESCTLTQAAGVFDLIINGTAAGMFPDVNGCPVPERMVLQARAVFDAVYNPLETTLLRLARQNGAKAQGGLPMLVWQAAAAQEIWTGARFAPEQVEALCREMAAFLQNEFGGRS